MRLLAFEFGAHDNILARIVASTTETVNLELFVEYDDGTRELIPLDVTHTAGDRVPRLTDTEPPFEKPGRVVGLSLDARASPIKRGEYYVTVFIRRGNDLHVYPIFSGHVTNAFFGGLGYFEDNLSGRGLKVDNEADSTLVNNTALTRTITVPTNAEIEMSMGTVLNGDDVSRGVNYYWDDGADVLGGWTTAQSADGQSIAASRQTNFPFTVGSSGSPFSNPGRVCLSAGDRIQIVWAAGGASAGGTGKSSAVWQEWLQE